MDIYYKNIKTYLKKKVPVNTNHYPTLLIFILIVFILFNILYVIYQYMIVRKFQYNSYIQLDHLKNVKYDSSKKVAVLLTGNVPSISTLVSQKIFIYNPLHTDIYCVLSCDENIKLDILELLQPVSIQFVQDKKYSDSWMNEFYQVMTANQLKKSKNINYDIVIRIRADLYVKSFIPEMVIDHIDDKTIYIPTMENNYFSLKIGVNDYFAMGSSQIMNVYSNFFYYIQEKPNPECDIHEYILKKYLNKENIKIITFYYPTILEKLKSNQIYYFYVIIKQYFKNLNKKYHCVLDEINFS